VAVLLMHVNKHWAFLFIYLFIYWFIVYLYFKHTKDSGSYSKTQTNNYSIKAEKKICESIYPGVQQTD
jgi:hypothetical protein